MTFLDTNAELDYNILVADGCAFAKKAHDYWVKSRKAQRHHDMELSRKYRRYSKYLDKQANVNARYAVMMIADVPHDDLTAQWIYLSFKESVKH